MVNPDRKAGDSTTMPQLQGLVETRGQSTYKSLTQLSMGDTSLVQYIQLGSSILRVAGITLYRSNGNK